MSKDVFSSVVHIIRACSGRWHSRPSQAYHRLENTGCIDSLLVRDCDALHAHSSDFDKGFYVTTLKARLSR